MSAQRLRTTAQDVEDWTRLVVESERCIERPMRSTVDLEKACDRCFRAVVPAGEATRDNPFFLLLSAARDVARATMAERAALTGALAKAIDAAKELRDLGVPTGERALSFEPRPLPYRADLDG